MYSPVLLNVSVSLPPNEVRGIADSSRLQNPFRTAMLVDEIRFAYSTNGSTNSGAGANIRAKFSLGRVPITNGFIPIWNFGKLQNSWEMMLVRASPVAGDAANINNAVWKLPKPLYIPATEYLVPEFQNVPLAYSSAFTFNVNVSIVGRSLPSNFPVPKSINMPWVTAFAGATRTAVDTTDKSTETDLVNPFNEPLNVQRFIGRLLYEDTGVASLSTDNSTWFSHVGSRLTTVRMADSLGRIAVRDETPFNHLFSAIDKSWTVNAKLPPKGFFIANLTETYSSLTGAGMTVTVTPFISMVGYREVRLNP